MRRNAIFTVILLSTLAQCIGVALAAVTMPTPAKPLPKFIHFTEIRQILNSQGEVVRTLPGGECWYALPFNCRIEYSAIIEVWKETPGEGVIYSSYVKEEMEFVQRPAANPSRIPDDYALPDYIIRYMKQVKGVTVVNGTGKYEGITYPTVTVTRPAAKNSKSQPYGRVVDTMYLDPKTGWIAVRIREQFDATDKWVKERSIFPTDYPETLADDIFTIPDHPTIEERMGDGGPATQARLTFPRGVALDADGNLYIADSKDRRIRKVDAKTGIITTVAGGGHAPGIPPKLATDASFNSMNAVAVDPNGNLWFTDDSVCLYKVDMKTGAFSTLIDKNGGQGEKFTNSPVNISTIRVLAVDRDGNLFFSSGFGHLLCFNPAQNAVTVVAGGGKDTGDVVPAKQAALGTLSGLAFDANNNLYFMAQDKSVLRRVNLERGTVETVFGPDRSIRRPGSMAIDPQGRIFYCSSIERKVYRIDPRDRTVTLIAGDGWRDMQTNAGRYAGDGGPAAQASLWSPAGVAVDAQGNIFIADSGNHCIRRVDAATGIITTVAGTGEPALQQR